MSELPVVCVHCQRAYKRVEMSRPFPWDHTDGYCPECTEKLDARLFGGRPHMTVKATVFTGKRKDANFHVEAGHA
jgi:hypothetical protein